MLGLREPARRACALVEREREPLRGGVGRVRPRRLHAGEDRRRREGGEARASAAGSLRVDRPARGGREEQRDEDRRRGGRGHAQGRRQEQRERREDERGGGRRESVGDPGGEGTQGRAGSQRLRRRERDRRDDRERRRERQQQRERRGERGEEEGPAREQPRPAGAVPQERRREERAGGAGEPRGDLHRERVRDERARQRPGRPERQERERRRRRGDNRREEGGAEAVRRRAERAWLAPDRRHRREQRGEGRDEADLARPRPGHDAERQDVEPRERTRDARLEVVLRERAREGERVLALVLDGRRVEVGEVVSRGVVAHGAEGEREVHAREAGPLERGEIGVVRQEVVDGGGDRGRHRPGERGQGAGEPGRRAARVEQDGRAGRPARLEVHHRPHLSRGGVRVKERGGADERGLLAVGDEEQHRAGERRALGERAGDLEQRGDAGEVVRRAGPRADRVVVRDEQDRTASRRARAEAGEHVPDERARPVDPAAERPLDGGLELEPAQAGHDGLHRRPAGVGADRARGAAPPERADGRERARRGELPRRRIGLERRGREAPPGREQPDRGGDRERRGEAGSGAHGGSLSRRRAGESTGATRRVDRSFSQGRRYEVP